MTGFTEFSRGLGANLFDRNVRWEVTCNRRKPSSSFPFFFSRRNARSLPFSRLARRESTACSSESNPWFEASTPPPLHLLLDHHPLSPSQPVASALILSFSPCLSQSFTLSRYLSISYPFHCMFILFHFSLTTLFVLLPFLRLQFVRCSQPVCKILSNIVLDIHSICCYNSNCCSNDSLNWLISRLCWCDREDG